MPKTTPFHERLAPLNQPGIWKNWSGYLVAPRYQYSETEEYYAIRNSAALLDTTPLFKYRIKGDDALEFLKKVMARDITSCNERQAQYTRWCDPAGYVLQDGVVLRISETEFWITAAEPTLRYFRKTAEANSLSNIEITDISDDYGILALQGPHSLDVLQQLTDAADSLGYFELAPANISGEPVIISRTGFTGDLGYEVWIAAEDAVTIWDAIVNAGRNYNLIPLGTTALKMARVEAGLLLMDVDFHSSRHAWVDAQRETPAELGWNWMFKKLSDDNREFIGRDALEQQLAAKSNRWTTVGLEVDWHDYERVHVEAGIMPPKHGVYREATMSIYRPGKIEWDYAGYASSFLFSSLLQKPIAIAKLPLDLAKRGTAVDLELPLIRQPVNVVARVTRMPFFNPKRKIAIVSSTV